MKSLFFLNPDITFLNHGSFGACPKPIFENYQYWQQQLETNPVQFMTQTVHEQRKISKISLSKYIGCSENDFFFTPNPTFAINTVMRSLRLQPGDEILSTNHEYGAMNRTWRFFSKKTGVKFVPQTITLPIISKAKILEEFWSGYTANTKVVFLNHISSATALIFPVKEICEQARKLGLIIIIDGAHVPGHIDLKISELDPDFYTGTLHKWMLAPKGCSFLYVKKSFQAILDPLVVGWGYENEVAIESLFLDYQEYQGTRDEAAFLTAPAVIAFLEKHNWAEKAAICRQLILDNYEDFCVLLGSKPICPLTSEFLGQMCSIPIQTTQPLLLKKLLFEKYKIEVPIMNIEKQYFLRITAQVYNTQNDFDILKLALIDIQKTTDYLG